MVLPTPVNVLWAQITLPSSQVSNNNTPPTQQLLFALTTWLATCHLICHCFTSVCVQNLLLVLNFVRFFFHFLSIYPRNFDIFSWVPIFSNVLWYFIVVTDLSEEDTFLFLFWKGQQKCFLRPTCRCQSFVLPLLSWIVV